MLGGAQSNLNLGYSGTYPVYHQAGIIAADHIGGLLPRELQSITWETVRELFKNKSPKVKKDIAEIWKGVADGKISRADAWNRILERSGGIGDPSWVSDLRSAPEGGTSYNSGRVYQKGLGEGADSVDGRMRSADAPAPSGLVKVERSLLFQKAGQELKGLYDRVTNQLTFINGKADVSTYIHENGHALKEILLKSADAPLILRLYGDSADVRGHERFARHLEKYFRTGKAPDAKLAPIFESIRGWMRDIYAKTFGGKIDPEVKAIFDNVYGTSDDRVDAFLKQLGADPNAPTPTAPTPTPTPGASPAGVVAAAVATPDVPTTTTVPTEPAATGQPAAAPTTNPVSSPAGTTDATTTTGNANTTTTETGTVRESGGVRGVSGVLEESVRPSAGAAGREADGSLLGLPRNVGGDYSPSVSPAIKKVAEDYMSSRNEPYNPPNTYVKVDKERAGRIAQAFEDMPHDPNNPEVKASYDALIKETLDQYRAITPNVAKVQGLGYQ